MAGSHLGTRGAARPAWRSRAGSAWLLDLLPAALAATVLCLLWRGVPLVDDGAIVLRYLDNFAAGHFYAYNAADGPIFGVSGFLHGLLAGALAWSRLLAPRASLLAVNWLGLTLAFLLTLRLLAAAGARGPGRPAGWLLAATAAAAFVISARQGLETPLHLAVVLLALWLLWRPHGRWLWTALALAVISKLDALPIAAVIGLLAVAAARLGDEGHGGRVPWRRLLGDALLAGALPLAAWVLFCLAVFGSPLPQSAYAKVHFHSHPGGFLPFLQPLRSLGWALLAAAVLTAVLTARRLWQRRARMLLRELAPGAAALACLGLYCAYNPGERMVWYYAVPEYLVFLQAALAALLLAAEVSVLPRGAAPLLAVGAMAAVAALAWPVTVRDTAYMIRYQRICETERIALGRFIRQHASPGDTLAVGLGHPAREAGLYTWDLSGLNSRAVTGLQARGRDVLSNLRFQWHAGQGLLESARQRELDLQLVAVGYDASAAYDLPACRVMRRMAPDSLLVARALPAFAVKRGQIKALSRPELLHVSGPVVELGPLDAVGQPAALWAGLGRGEEERLVDLETLDGAGAVLDRRRLELPPVRPADFAGGASTALELPLPAGATAVRLTAVGPGADGGPGADVLLLEPVLLLRRERVRFDGVEFGDGWLPEESWGRWAGARRANLRVRVEADARALHLETAPSPGLPQGQSLRVLIDGALAGTFEVRGEPWTWRVLTVPLPAGPARRLRVALQFQDLQPPTPEDPVARALPFRDLTVR